MSLLSGYVAQPATKYVLICHLFAKGFWQQLILGVNYSNRPLGLNAVVREVYQLVPALPVGISSVGSGLQRKRGPKIL